MTLRDAASSRATTIERDRRDRVPRAAAGRTTPARLRHRTRRLRRVSYFFAAAAITGGRVTVAGLTRESLQGDVRFVDVLEQMGCRVEDCDAGITVHGRPARAASTWT